MNSSLKKVFAFILALSMVFTMSAVVFAADEDTEVSTEADATVDETAVDETAVDDDDEAVVSDEAAAAISEVLGTEDVVTTLPSLDLKFASEYRFVNALGIFEFLDDDFWQTQEVTRAQFATIIAKMLKAQTEGYPLYDNSPFSDINSSHFAYSAVCYLTDIGIIHGDGNATFRPDEAITAAEATKMVMCALGYGDVAENYMGGYPMGYITYAQIYDVYDDLSLAQDQTLDALTVGKLIKNALEAEILEGVVYTSEGVQYMFTDKTLLSETYEITQDYGVVNGTYYGYINGNELDTEGEVEIGGTVYQVTDGIDPEEYLGYMVDYYYMTEVTGYYADVVVYMEPRANKNSSVTVLAQDIYSFDGDKITYADPDTGKEKKVTITDSTVVALNGEPYYTYSEDDLALKEGNMTIISHNSSLSTADVVIINEFYDGIVERVSSSSKQVVFKNNSSSTSEYALPTLVLDEEDNSYRARLTMNGEPITSDDLIKGDVITYTVSEDGYYIRGYVSRDEIYDTITEKRTEKTAAGEVEVVKVDGVEYYISKYCTANINAGSTLDMLLSFDGRIVGTKTTAANGGNYAFLIATEAEDGSISSTVQVKLFTSDGEMGIYNCASKVKTNIDGVVKSYKSSDFSTLVTSNFADPTLVVYEKNSAGEIKTLYKPVDYTSTYSPYDELGFGKYYENKSARLQNNLIASCAIDDSTVIFQVPFTDRDRDSDYKVTSASELSNGTYNVEIYDIDRGIAGVLVIKDSEPNKVSDTASVLVVDEVVRSYDEDTQEIMIQIDGFAGGEAVSLVIDEDTTPTVSSGLGFDVDPEELGRGDVVQYSLGSNGYIGQYRVLFDCSERASVSYWEWNEDGTDYKVLPDSDLYVIHGEALDVYDYYIVASSRVNGEAYYTTYQMTTSSTASTSDEIQYKKAISTTKANIYEYNVEKNEITVSDPYEIEAGDEVFIHTKDVDSVVDILFIRE